jgi:hypothetical protein
MQKSGYLFGVQLAQRGATLSGEDEGKFGQFFVSQPNSEVGQGRIETVAEQEGRQWAGAIVLPHHVQYHLPISRIRVMAMSDPATRRDVDLDITGEGRVVVELNHGRSEIGARFAIPEPRVKNTQAPAVHGSQLIAAQALMIPNDLEQMFGRARITFMKNRGCTCAQACLRVKTLSGTNHLAVAFGASALQSQGSTDDYDFAC